MSFKLYDKMSCDCYTSKAEKGRLTFDFRSNKRRW